MSTSITRKPTQGATAPSTSKPAIPPREAIASMDRITMNLTVARAICDAVKVLAALERTPGAQGGDSDIFTGEGYADGFTVFDATMPSLLHHAATLMSNIKEDAKGLFLAAGGRA